MNYYSVTFSLQNILYFYNKNMEYLLGTPYLHINI